MAKKGQPRDQLKAEHMRFMVAWPKKGSRQTKKLHPVTTKDLMGMSVGPRKKSNPHYIVHDDSGKAIVRTKSRKAAAYIARAASGLVKKGERIVYSAIRQVKKNPLPVNRWVTVKARRTSGGRIQLRGTR